MNANFISIKVDREEHPDIDQLYMNATQMITGSGGWPQNVACLPDGTTSIRRYLSYPKTMDGSPRENPKTLYQRQITT